MKRLSVYLLLIFMLAMASRVQATSITSFYNRAGFDAAVGTTTLEDFLSTAHFPITSGILNEFIGEASAEKTQPGAAAAAEDGAPTDRRSRAIEEFVARRAQERAVEGDEKTKIGQLSDSTKILADKRTNSLLLMGRACWGRSGNRPGNPSILQSSRGNLNIELGHARLPAVRVLQELDSLLTVARLHTSERTVLLGDEEFIQVAVGAVWD